MSMTFDSENAVVKTLNVEVTTVRFAAVAADLREAGILFREAVGQVKSLNDSLLGAHPIYAAALGIDQARHVEVRKFRDEEGLEVYKTYINGLTDYALRLADEKIPLFSDQQAYGFTYGTCSGRAGIALQYDANDHEWRVSGFAKLLNPTIVERNLKKKGFEVTSEK